LLYFADFLEELEKAAGVGIANAVGHFRDQPAGAAGAELYTGLVHQFLNGDLHRVAAGCTFRTQHKRQTSLRTRLGNEFLLIVSSTMTMQPGIEQQITHGPGGRILTNAGVWSPDGQWIVYDTRSDPAGDTFNGSRIEMVHVDTGEVRVLYEARNGAYCGVVTFHPHEDKVVFILGPENPTPDWAYSSCHRQGVTVDVYQPGIHRNLDARDIVPPFTPGALRGGSHVHVWDPRGEWVSFTYEDHVLASREDSHGAGDINQRNVGVSVADCPVNVTGAHPRNHNGDAFTVLVTRTTSNPKPGSDEIVRAFEEAWVGSNGYLRSDGTRQGRALAFQGHVRNQRGELVPEVFMADLPDDLTQAGDGPLEGSSTLRPCPPRGVAQRRLTFLVNRKHPGIQGPRHWLRSSPDGSHIAFLARDDSGVVQLWTVSPNGGEPRQITRNSRDIASAFTWSPDGEYIAHTMDGSVCQTHVPTGRTRRLTPPGSANSGLRPEACVFSPDGRKIAYVRRTSVTGGGEANQICLVSVP
jgi:WD40 repeat protein